MHPHHRPVPKWATYATPVAVMVVVGAGVGHRRRRADQHGHRGAPVRAAEQDGVHEQRHELVPLDAVGPAGRPAGGPRRRRRTPRRRTRRTAASSPGRPRGGPSTSPGRSASWRRRGRPSGCHPRGRRAAAPAARADRTARAARVATRSTSASAPGSRRPASTARAGQRPDSALDVERGPVVGRREVDRLRADVAAEVGVEAAEPRPGRAVDGGEAPAEVLLGARPPRPPARSTPAPARAGPRARPRARRWRRSPAGPAGRRPPARTCRGAGRRASWRTAARRACPTGRRWRCRRR